MTNLMQQAPKKKTAGDDIIHRTPPAGANLTTARGMVKPQGYASGTDDVPPGAPQQNSWLDTARNALNFVTPQGRMVGGFTDSFGKAMNDAAGAVPSPEPKGYADGDANVLPAYPIAPAGPGDHPMPARQPVSVSQVPTIFQPSPAGSTLAPKHAATPVPQTANQASNILSAVTGVPAHLFAAARGMISGEPAPAAAPPPGVTMSAADFENSPAARSQGWTGNRAADIQAAETRYAQGGGYQGNSGPFLPGGGPAPALNAPVTAVAAPTAAAGPSLMDRLGGMFGGGHAPMDPLTPAGGANTTFLGENYKADVARNLGGTAPVAPVAGGIPVYGSSGQLLHTGAPGAPGYYPDPAQALMDAHANPGAHTPESFAAAHAGLTNNQVMQLTALLHPRTVQEQAMGSYLNHLIQTGDKDAYYQAVKALGIGQNFPMLFGNANPSNTGQ